jgi:hypothetical protein
MAAKKTAAINFRLEPEVAEAWQNDARESGLTLSEWLREQVRLAKESGGEATHAGLADRLSDVARQKKIKLADGMKLTEWLDLTIGLRSKFVGRNRKRKESAQSDCLPSNPYLERQIHSLANSANQIARVLNTRPYLSATKYKVLEEHLRLIHIGVNKLAGQHLSFVRSIAEKSTSVETVDMVEESEDEK